MITYIDTSTLIKLLIDEVGTAEAGLIWDAPDALVSTRVGHVGSCAALARHARNPDDLDEELHQFAIETMAGTPSVWSSSPTGFHGHAPH